MSATAAQIAQVRRMTAEPIAGDYSDSAIRAYIEAYPCIDERGELPYTWDSSTTPPTQDANTEWVTTYDLHAAAADIWEEKAAAVADRFDVTVDSGAYTRSQAYVHAQAQARYHRARRKLSTHALYAYPTANDDGPEWVVN